MPSPILEFSKLLGLLMFYSDDLNLSDYGFLLSCINDRNLDEYEIKDLAEFLEILGIDDESIFNKMEIDLEEFLIEEMDSRKYDVDISKYLQVFQDRDGSLDFDYDRANIEDAISPIIVEIIEGFYSDLIRDLNIDFQNIIDTIDIDQMISDFLDSQYQEDMESYHVSSNTFDRDIDELFERS